jgi:hypothetical protein
MQVADCYIHVRYRRLGTYEFDDLREHLLGVATELARTVRRGRDIDYTFEEGTLLQRILVYGSITLGAYNLIASYHDFRESVIEMAHDAETFGGDVFGRFHMLTDTKPDDEIYKRSTSRDVNRLRRIIADFDEASKGHLPASDLTRMRRRVIHDLAGLARANPDDPEVTTLMRHLPKHPIPNLPSTPLEAIRIDDRELERAQQQGGEPSLGQGAGESARRPPRRRFHTRVTITR